MNTHADKTQINKSQAVANSLPTLQSEGESTFQFADNRPEAIAQRKLQQAINNSPRVQQLKAYQEMANNSSQVKQLMANNFNSKAAQRKESLEEEILQGKFEPIQKKENNTGLPDNLKSGIENLSGFSMDDVKVHYNSDKPAQLQAYGYAQGKDIHLASGQEKHLPHEAWHVVQQKQGRVKPTVQMKDKVNIIDDAQLEKEADVMGEKAFQFIINSSETKKANNFTTGLVVQKVKVSGRDTNNPSDNEYLFEAYRHQDIDTLYKLQKSIGAELADGGQQVDKENAEKHLVKLTEAIQLIQLHAVSSASNAQGTIVVSGNVQLDDEILGWSPIAPAGKTPEPNQFKLVPSSIGEYRISQNDAEGKTLTFLYKIIENNIARISHGKHLQINIQGTYGPCDGCKERISQFRAKITKLIKERHVLVNRLVLWVNVLYNNPPLSKVRGENLRTTYGWRDDQVREYDAIEPIERFSHTEIFIIRPL